MLLDNAHFLVINMTRVWVEGLEILNFKQAGKWQVKATNAWDKSIPQPPKEKLYFKQVSKF